MRARRIIIHRTEFKYSELIYSALKSNLDFLQRILQRLQFTFHSFHKGPFVHLGADKVLRTLLKLTKNKAKN